MKSENNNSSQEDDNLEILVNVPPSDGELFVNMLTGKRSPNPIKMTMKEYKSLRSFYSFGLAAVTLLFGISSYQLISEEVSKHGSLKNAYNSYIEASKKVPWNALYP